MPPLGRVETQSVTLFEADAPLTLESGATLAPVRVAYETYGMPNRTRSNVVFVCHALSGDAHAAGHHGDPRQRGWWDAMVGPGRPVDTDRFFVVCANLLGGCAGTTGPSSVDPHTQAHYGMRFPLFTVRDLVSLHRALLRKLGIDRVHAAIGGSLGGMQVLQWTLDHPAEVECAVLICTSARLSAQNLALNAIARRAIVEDPDFQGGNYLGSARRPHRGLSLARQIGHVNYLSIEAMHRKFDRTRRGGAGAPMTMASDFEVEHYLDHQADSFVRRFDALSYIYLLRAMDYFDPFDEQLSEPDEAHSRVLAISFDSDWRFGSEHSRELVEALRARGISARHFEVSSPWGHDSFLTDGDSYSQLLKLALGDSAMALAASPV